MRLCLTVGATVPAIALAFVLACGCGGVSGAGLGADAAAGASGHGGGAGSGAGGSTGAGGSAGTGGSGTAGSTGTAGSNGGSTGGSGVAGSTGSGGRGGATGSAGTGGSTGSGGSAGGRGGTTGAAGAGGSTGSGGSAGRGGAGGAAGGGGAGGTSACQAVLALDRSCTTPADCFGGAHVTNCCGQVQFIGLRMSEQARFQTLEAQCDATYPACGCAAQQPFADDGSRLRFDDKPGVTCQQGVCTTFVSDCGKPCAAGTTCFSCSNRNSVFAACTTTCASSTACQDPALPLCQMGSSGNTAGMFCTAANVACDTK